MTAPAAAARPGRARVLLLILAGLVVAGGIGSVPFLMSRSTTTGLSNGGPAPSPPPGARRVEVKSGGFAIALPASWDVVEPTPERIQELMQERGADSAAALLLAGRKFRESGKLFALEPGGGVLTVVQDAADPKQGRIERLRRDIARSYEGEDALDVETTITRVAAGDAIRVRALPAGGSGTKTVQYIVPAGSTNYILTFTFPSVAVDEKPIDRLIATFERL